METKRWNLGREGGHSREGVEQKTQAEDRTTAAAKVALIQGRSPTDQGRG